MNRHARSRGAGWAESVSAREDGMTMKDPMELLRDRSGFRLVFDEDERRDRGAPWSEQPSHARVASSHRSFAGAGFNALGFRLCVDWSEG